MGIKITKKDVKWSYISLFFLNGVNLILLPFILRYLDSAELGLWFTFTALSGLIVLLDFGFMTTFSRNITFIWAGAEEINQEGFEKSSSAQTSPNYNLFVKLFKVTKRFYTLLSLGILLILLTIGSFYVYKVSIGEINIKVALTSWFIYMVSIFLNMKYAYWNSILRGIGAIEKNQKVSVLTKVSQLIFTIAFLFMGLGLIGVSLAYLISVIINRVSSNIVFYRYQSNKEILKPIMKIKYDKNELKLLFKTILPNAYKQGMISISNFINQRSLTLVSSAFLGLSITGTLGLIIQVVTLINSVANTYFNTYLSQFSDYRLKDKKELLSLRFKKSIIINNVLIISAYTFIFLLGQPVLNIIGSDVELLPSYYLIIIFIYMFLYNNHMLFATFLATANTLPHYRAFFISSIIVIILQIITLSFWSDLWGLLIPLLIVNLFYNNWKWPLEVIKDLGENPKNFYFDIIVRFKSILRC